MERNRRLPNGLLLDQNQVIQALQLQPDWKKACDSVGVSHASFRRWLREDTAFRTTYEVMHANTLDAVRAQFDATAQKAAEVFDEALDATKDVTIEIECPNCHQQVKVTAEIPDYGIRMQAGRTSLQVSKILKDVKEVGGTITIAQLPLHLQLAYAAYRRDGERAIPPGHFDQLVQYGIIKRELPAPAEDPNITEGEYTVLEDGSEIDPSDE